MSGNTQYIFTISLIQMTGQSKDDIQVGAEQQKSWHMILDEYIDSLSDDTVLVGVDYHI